MPAYYKIHILRSDGKLDFTSSGRLQPNRPTDSQLDKSPNAKGVIDFYRKVNPHDAKETDWRKKLGGMLAKQLGQAEQNGIYQNHQLKFHSPIGHTDKRYILAALPENYRLYEHEKWSADSDSKSKRPNEKHAKGGADRHDAYLYGHPKGHRKRYRSPREFFPHLLWLATDPTGDPRNCSCKICAPDPPGTSQSNGKVSAAATAATAAPPPAKEVKKESIDSKDPSSAPMPPPDKPIPIPAEKTTPKSGPTAGPSKPVPPPTPTTQVATPTPLPPQRSNEQALDAQYNQFLYRPGELVWFNRGMTWGLATVVRREFITNPSPQQPNQRKKYIIQPLSHPFMYPEMAVVTKEDLLRPWLAWSAPEPTHEALRLLGLTYDTIEWRAVAQGHLGRGDVEVDGSIFAARMVDESYTLFDKVDTPRATPGETRWNGVYLGGEKIFLGEPVRLRIGSGSDIMILHDIVERIRQDFHDSGSISTVYLVGDIYTFKTIMHNPNELPPENLHLPQRLREDLRFRNATTIANKGTVSFWNFVQPLSRLELGDIKGRWYESSLLLPILRGHEDFVRDYQRGEISDSGTWMNGRMETSTNGNKIGRRFPTRREAFGRAVPPGLTFSEARDGQADTRRSFARVELPATDYSRAVDFQDRNELGISLMDMNWDGMDPDRLMQQFTDEDQFLDDTLKE
ncbi:hypothetical protein GP486_005800 [Trichoglossum hirsutum]|uniref:Cryptic loci regulator 2 N-terminal domain-containing protein n=1 Tax=Trichoglossum hirsutum TaxID=265104 RepID=A0A9P8L8M0_9PEZI|nr:hypothetical protein GP486_005800 [Trichoglossum hirsutum]